MSNLGNYKKAGWLAFGVHLVALFFLAYMALRKERASLEVPYVFTLVESPTFQPGEIQGEPPKKVDIELPEIEHPPLPDLPDLPQEPVLEEVLPPAPPELPKESPKKQESAKEKAVSVKDSPKKVSYDEFVKKQGVPKKSVKKTAAKKPLNTDDVKKELSKALAPTTKGSTVGSKDAKGERALASGPVVSASALAAFNSQLLKKIDAAWIKPVAEITEGLVAVVEFYVAPNGAISNVQIVQSSGNPVVDRSVSAAFARVGNAGKPPDAYGGTYRVTFRMVH